MEKEMKETVKSFTTSFAVGFIISASIALISVASKK
jgi:hypothetical protein